MLRRHGHVRLELADPPAARVLKLEQPRDARSRRRRAPPTARVTARPSRRRPRIGAGRPSRGRTIRDTRAQRYAEAGGGTGWPPVATDESGRSRSPARRRDCSSARRRGRSGSRPPSWPASRVRPRAGAHDIRSVSGPGRWPAVPGRPANVAAGSRLTRDQRSSPGRAARHLAAHQRRRGSRPRVAARSGTPLETTVRYWPRSGRAR